MNELKKEKAGGAQCARPTWLLAQAQQALALHDHKIGGH